MTCFSDRIVVFGDAPQTLDVLRLATIRSDHVALIASQTDGATRQFIDRFAIDDRQGLPREADIAGAASVLVTIGQLDTEMPLSEWRSGKGSRSMWVIGRWSPTFPCSNFWNAVRRRSRPKVWLFRRDSPDLYWPP
jgi:hypothetical protein